MNSIIPFEPLQVLGHLTHALPAATVAAVIPSSARSTHYGPDGKTVRHTAVTSFAGVRCSARGEISGGSLSQVTHTPGGALLGQSSVAVAQGGLPVTLQLDVQSRFGGGVFKRVQADLAALQWTAATTIHGGTVAITTHDAVSGATRMQGQLQFANESLQSAAFAHRAWAGDGKVHSYTNVDYSAAQLVGMHLVGGECAVTVKDAQLRVLSQSTVSVSPAGCVMRIATQTFDAASGRSKRQVAADFSGVSFDAHGQIDQGVAGFVVTGAKGSVKSRTSARYAAGVPEETTTHTFSSGRAQYKVVTDYSKTQFNNDLVPVSSSVTAKAYDAAGTLLSITTTTHDSTGQVRSRRIERFTASGGSLSTTEADYSLTDFDTHGGSCGGNVTTTTSTPGGLCTVTRRDLPGGSGTAEPIAAFFAAPAPIPAPTYQHERSVVRAPDRSPLTQTERITRADGTLLRTTTTSFEQQRPSSSKITNFAADGTSVVSSSAVDLSALDFDPATSRATGTIGIAARFRGVTPSATTVLSFCDGT